MVVGCRWVFKRKNEIPGIEKERFKARVVAKGFTQVQVIILIRYTHQL